MDSMAILTAPVEVAAPKAAAPKSLTGSSASGGQGNHHFLKSLHSAVRALRGQGQQTQADRSAPGANSGVSQSRQLSAPAEGYPAADSGAIAGQRADVVDETASEPTHAELLAALMQPLDPRGQEALARIASLAAGGVIDGQELAGLDEQALGDLADWALAGAGGIFAPFAEGENAAGAGTESGLVGLLAGGADFGLGQAAQALSQLQTLQERVAEADALTSAEGFNNYLTQLCGAEAIDTLALDKAANSLLSSLTQAVQDAGGDPEGMSLRDLIQAVSPEKLTDMTNAALAKAGATQKLPVLPESVLRSLCIEVINVNNGTTSAADQRAALLDGLENNGILRAEILRQASAEIADGADLACAADKNTLARAAQRLLSDNSAQEEEGSLNSGTAIAKDLSAGTGNPQSGAIVEEISGTVTSDGEETAASSVGQQVSGKNEESITEKNNGEDVLTEKNLSGQSATSNSGENGTDEDAGGKQGLMQPTEEESLSEEELTAHEADAMAGRAAAGDERFQSVEPLRATENTASASRTENQPAPRYAEMAENIERLEKLLRVSSGNDLKNITLQLNPHELGRITIDVEYRDGAVHATIKAENEAARDLLMGGTDQLKRNLEASGIKIESLDVSVDREGNDQNSGRNQTEWEAAREEQQKRQRDRGRENGQDAQNVSDEQELELATEAYNGEGPLNIIA